MPDRDLGQGQGSLYILYFFTRDPDTQMYGRKVWHGKLHTVLESASFGEITLLMRNICTGFGSNVNSTLAKVAIRITGGCIDHKDKLHNICISRDFEPAI